MFMVHGGLIFYFRSKINILIEKFIGMKICDQDIFI